MQAVRSHNKKESGLLGFSQTVSYAIRALACIPPVGSGSAARIHEIAECTKIPKPYLGKIIAQLVKTGLVLTLRGRHGGVVLARDPATISLKEVVIAIEGPQTFERCLLGLHDCSDERACPTHELWNQTRGILLRGLEEMTLADVAKFEHRNGLPLCGQQVCDDPDLAKGAHHG